MVNEKATQPVVLFDNVIRWTLITAVALLPLLMSPVNVDAYDLPKATLLYALALIAGASYISRSLLAGKFVVKRSPLNKPLFAFAVMATIATIVAPVPLMSIVGQYTRYENLPTIYSLVLLSFFATQYLSEKQWFNRTVSYSFIAFGVISIYGVLQSLGFDIVNSVLSEKTLAAFGTRVTSTLGNPVFFGGYLAIMLPILFNYLIDDENLPFMPKSVIGTLMVLGITGLAISGTRGAWAAAIIGIIVITILRRDQLAKAAGTAFAMLVFGIAFMLLVLSLAGPNIAQNQLASIKDRLVTSADLSQGSAVSRLENWKLAVNMISIRPLGGYGPDQMQLWSGAFMSLKQAQLEPNTVPDRAHNIFLQAAVNGGAVNLIVYLWIFAIIIISLARALKRRNGSRGYVLGISGAFAAYIIQGFSGIDIIGITPMVWIMAGAVVGIAAYDAPERVLVTWPFKRYVEAIAVTFLVASALIVLAARPVIADSYYYDGVLSRYYGHTDRTIASFTNAINLNPYRGQYRADLSAVLMAQGNTLNNPAIMDKALVLADEGLRYNHEDATLMLAAASIYRLYASMVKDEAMIGQAESFYSSAMNKAPYDINPRRGLLGLRMLLEAYTDAIEQANTILQIDPNDSDVKFRLAQAYEKTGKVGRAKLIYQDLLQKNPNQQDVKDALNNIGKNQ
ncbi:MAG TPA: O-antigen ligase family protein [Candidatus Aquicultor sp.]|jgi:O-antigen ligase